MLITFLGSIKIDSGDSSGREERIGTVSPFCLFDAALPKNHLILSTNGKGFFPETTPPPPLFKWILPTKEKSKAEIKMGDMPGFKIKESRCLAGRL